ncbi:MAG: DNA glycosylase [Candidatus Nanohaloarchaea archaeon]|nr:DNA glycosylase [Candidatus Nanohaloarchaea archaeon]
MRKGKVEIGEKELDLETTLEVGQTFSWHKTSGENLYTGEGDRYYTTKNGNVLVLWQEGGDLHYKAAGGMEKEMENRLRLHESLGEIHSDLKGEDRHLDQALERYRGLRIVKDDFFPCLISYLCSPQMRIPRIKKMFDSIAEKYGKKVEFNGKTFLQFPEVQQLAEASEEDLRELGIGYRAKYIVNSVEQIMKGEVDPEDMENMDYKDAHQEIQKLYGVGDKVADCVLLFGLGHLQAFPIDTWIRKTVEQHYPERHSDSYMEIGDSFREWFGDHVGYAQEYLFHHMRKKESA